MVDITYPSWNLTAATLKMGRNLALGAPTGTPSAATNGAGSLTGTYKYAYTESAGGGETTASALATVVSSSNTNRVTVPPPRRGVDRRKLYRSVAGGTALFLVHDFGGAGGYFQTRWDDNTADGSLGAAAPTSDTSIIYTINMAPGVKTISTHPDQGSGAADLTMLTGDSGNTAGAFAMDVYGEYFGRTSLGNTFGSLKTGTSGTHFLAQWQDVVDGGASAATVAQIMAKGNLVLTPQTLSDPALADSMGAALSVTATAPTTPTATQVANQIITTGAGSASFSQTNLLANFNAGYTGSSGTYALRGSNASANTGTSFGLSMLASGAAGVSVGVSGVSSAGTKQIGVFGSSGGIDLATTALTFPSGITGIAGAFSNGANSDDIIVGFDNVTSVFRVTNNGGMECQGLAGNSSTTYNFGTSGKGNFSLVANGNTSIDHGSSNNVPVNLKANGNTVATLNTDQSFQLTTISTPGSPANGSIWFDGTNLKIRIGGATKTVTVS